MNWPIYLRNPCRLVLDDHMPDTTDEEEALRLLIRTVMLHKQVSQQELARRLGWVQTMVSRRLTGKTPIGFAEAVRIADVLGVPVTSLGFSLTTTPLSDYARRMPASGQGVRS